MERTIHGVTWKDPLAWMEEMKSKRWKDFVSTEQEHWQRQVSKTKESLRTLLKTELEASSAMNNAYLFGSLRVEVAVKSNVNLSWKFENKESREAVVFDICKKYPGFAWVVEEAPGSGGAEQYALRCYVKERKEPVWSHDNPIAPAVAVVNGRVFCIEAKKKLVYFRVVSYNALTGKDRRVHYEEENQQYNLELIRCSCDIVYVRRQAGCKQDLLWFNGREDGVCDGSSLESRRFVVGNHVDCYWVWERMTGWRMSKGLRRHGFQMPMLNHSVTPESLDCVKGWLITKTKGERTLWKIHKGKPAEHMWQGFGQIMMDPWGGPFVRIVEAGKEVVWWNSESQDGIPRGVGYDVDKIDLGRGTRVLLVKPKRKPVGMLVTGYGAYGLSTPLSTARWEPLLSRGWIVAIGLWRGGGDHTPEWEDAGRRHGREAVLEDVEEALRELHVKTGMKPSQTVLNGRSAGGLWVGGMVAKFSKGELFTGAYMEVPYLDVLRTTTNHTLPLTDIEADEFGLPSQRVSDFVSVLRWSPMENVPKEGVRGVWQIVRTGLNDSEVYPYESATWDVRGGQRALLAVEADQGHFVSGRTGLQQRAEDLAVLLDLFHSK